MLSSVGVPKVGGGHFNREAWQCTVCRHVFNRNVGSGRQVTYKDVEKESGAQ